MSNHAHKCATCGYTWECEEVKGCKVEAAAKTNREGPHCILCLHIIMARRYANHRAVVLEQFIKEQEL